MATVVVDMGTCGMEHRITVSRNPDGTLTVSADTPCAQVARYIDSLGPLTEDDLIDFSTSAVFDCSNVRPLTLTCLVPAGVAHAAFLETGMIARSLALKARPDSIRFTDV